MVKDAFEDYQKYKQDKQENETKVQIYDRNLNEFKETTWAQLRPGDMVKVQKDQPVPADMIACSSSNEKGAIYVETKSLDGETNLKLKTVPHEIY